MGKHYLKCLVCGREEGRSSHVKYFSLPDNKDSLKNAAKKYNVEQITFPEEIHEIRPEQVTILNHASNPDDPVEVFTSSGGFVVYNKHPKFDAVYTIEGQRIVQIQMQSSFPPGSEEIKIENETLQETTIQTIPANHSENSISNIKPESISETSWSCIRPGGETFMNSVTSTSNTFFQSLNEGSCSVSDNFEDNSNSSTKIDRRKTNVEESLSCLKELIEATAKPDSLTLFGKYIAHKLRASKKDVAEINIAKLNIEKVLENLAVGAYNSEIVKQEI